MRVARILGLPLLITTASCADKPSAAPGSSPPPPASAVSPAAALRALPAELSRGMVTAGKACIVRFRPSMPVSYEVQVVLARSDTGFLAMELQSGDRPDFNTCIVDAIEAARIPAGELREPLVMPLAFSFEDRD